MLRNGIARALSVLVLVAGSWGQRPVATGTYAVGTCKPGLPTYTTISLALAATPAPSTVLVCPGTYVEQILITQPVNLQGVTSGGSGQVVVQVTPIGYVLQEPNGSGSLIGAQLFVINSPGPVTISDITFDASSGGIYFGIAGGIFLQNSPVTVSRVTTRNDHTQAANNFGILIEGGASNPSVSVVNSSIHDSAESGIWVETLNGPITAALKGNYVSANSYGIFLDAGSAGTIANNVIAGGGNGVFAETGSTGTVSGNTILGSTVGVDLASDGVSVTNNKIYNNTFAGIYAYTATATVQGNTINGGPVGIDFVCSTNPNIKSNVLSEVDIGLDHVSAGASPVNSYFNVGTIRSQANCPGAK